MFAGRTIRHAIDKVYLGLYGDSDLERRDRECLLFAMGDLGGFVILAFGKLALNAFILLFSVSHCKVLK